MENIVSVLSSCEKVAIFVHTSADADALGSAFSLKYVLEKNDKAADVYLNEKVSERLSFLQKFCLLEYQLGELKDGYDLFVALDCGDEGRLGVYKDCFVSFDKTVNIDHHFTNKEYAKYNYVDGNASATGEIITDLLSKMNFTLDKNIAALLYAAISSDTGCFAYSNVTKKTHVLAGKLLEFGIDSAEINRLLFKTFSLLELKLQSFVIENMKVFHNGKLAVAAITENQLKKFGASYEHTEGLVDILRSVKDVEIGCLIKEQDGKTKGSIRTNTFVDAAEISAIFGGGGHKRAAGFSTELSVEDTLNKFVEITKDLF
ncbi:MAG: bifunctional oligoribonuclease/PAP phosphatase NrnA [Clostridia bacterium]|nr:bifunctional oligoribonuclease/PAP phosphatase NrnA [Clostridia bacterium]